MPTRSFDDLAPVYEAMIDWPKRLAHEGPFYRRLLERVGARSVLDAACGTGHHAALFHSWGLRVEGADISPSMIARAKAQFGEPEGLHWAVRAFDQPAVAAGRVPGVESSCPSPDGAHQGVDVAICVGNSIALAPDMHGVERALMYLLAAVRPGGAVVVHVLNLWSLPDGPCVWQKCLHANLLPGAQGDCLVMKGVHRSGARGYVELIVVAPESGKLLQTESVPFLGMEATDLESLAARAGARRISIYGGYQDQPYDRGKSTDLLMVVEK
jgi:SAM-dependent methyltransferase